MRGAVRRPLDGVVRPRIGNGSDGVDYWVGHNLYSMLRSMRLAANAFAAPNSPKATTRRTVCDPIESLSATSCKTKTHAIRARPPMTPRNAPLPSRVDRVAPHALHLCVGLRMETEAGSSRTTSALPHAGHLPLDVERLSMSGVTWWVQPRKTELLRFRMTGPNV